jgi:hypothetical protein
MAIVAMVVAVAACGNSYGDNGNGPQPPLGTVITASGDLAAALTQFRTALGGDSSNKVAGEQPTGRREINWEAVAGANLNSNTFQPDLFNTTIPRGQVFGTPGTGLRVSSVDAIDIDSSYAAQFNPFSGSKTFFAVGSTEMDVQFQVAGATTAAVVNGFGVVFSDVDVAGSSFVEYYSTGGTLLRRVNAPVRSDANGFSLVSVVFDEPIVGSVRIVAGQAPLAAGIRDITDGGTKDLVIVDDFIGGEPHPGGAAN